MLTFVILGVGRSYLLIDRLCRASVTTGMLDSTLFLCIERLGNYSGGPPEKKVAEKFGVYCYWKGLGNYSVL